MNLTEWSSYCHYLAKEKGFYDNVPAGEHKNTGEQLMLITSELGEALEADRKERYSEIDKPLAVLDQGLPTKDFITSFEMFVKDTFEDELADSVIRLFDLCGERGIDLHDHVELKLIYNSTRGYKHGKSY